MANVTEEETKKFTGGVGVDDDVSEERVDYGVDDNENEVMRDGVVKHESFNIDSAVYDDEDGYGYGDDGGGDGGRGGGGAGDSSPGKIFVGGVPWDTDEETFAKHFAKYGEITDSVIMKEKHTRKPRGFGFITFADPAVLDQVLIDKHEINGRMVEIKKTVPRENRQGGEGGNGRGVGTQIKKIFVGGILPSITEDELKEYFSSFGNIVEHQIMLDHHSGRSRGFGFVTFDNADVVNEIISSGKTYELGGKEVEIKKAEPRGAEGRGSRDRYSESFARSRGGGYGVDGYGSGGSFSSTSSYGGRAAGGYGQGYSTSAPSTYDAYGYDAGYASAYGGSMYGSGGYGDVPYGSAAGYSAAYGGVGAYGGRYGGAGGYIGGYGGDSYYDAGGYGSGKGYGNGRAGNYGGARGYGGGRDSSTHNYGSSKKYESGAGRGTRGNYHPYQR